jgi:Zn-dependent protease
VSNIQREPRSPGGEFLMAIVGPLTSIVLGVIFFVLGGVSTGSVVQAVRSSPAGLTHLSPLAVILLWLGQINILLGLFILIPGFPLDGGRVPRSIPWTATGSLRAATRWAS